MCSGVFQQTCLWFALAVRRAGVTVAPVLAAPVLGAPPASPAFADTIAACGISAALIPITTLRGLQRLQNLCKGVLGAMLRCWLDGIIAAFQQLQRIAHLRPACTIVAVLGRIGAL
jgi:hypothetical protein